MVTATLKSHLEQLRRELAEGKALDKDARRALKGVADEIERVLATTEPDVQSVRARIEATGLGFEAQHPRFAQLLSQITDTLAKLGI